MVTLLQHRVQYAYWTTAFVSRLHLPGEDIPLIKAAVEVPMQYEPSVYAP